MRSRNGRSPRWTICRAAISSRWNSSVRRQSCASGATVRITGSLPMSPVPLSLSNVQTATITDAGTPNCCSMRPSSAACTCISFLARLRRAGMTRGGGVFLEALGVEHAALAAVEGEDGGVGHQAGEGLVDDPARDALALRVARARGREGVEIAAAWRGARGGGDDQQDEGKEEAAGLPHPHILSRKDPTRHIICNGT